MIGATLAKNQPEKERSAFGQAVNKFVKDHKPFRRSSFALTGFPRVDYPDDCLNIEVIAGICRRSCSGRHTTVSAVDPLLGLILQLHGDPGNHAVCRPPSHQLLHLDGCSQATGCIT